MRLRVLDFLACPDCQSPYEVKVFKRDKRNALSAEMTQVRCGDYCAREGIATPQQALKATDCFLCYTDEIIDGILTCKCGSNYPIVGGIPRILPNALEEHDEFVKKYGIKRRPDNEPVSSQDEFQKLYGRTQKSFGFEWLKYEVTDPREDEVVYFQKMGITPEYLREKLVLEAGCGMGRYLNVINKHGCEAVGLDLSRAVERAYKITGSSPFTHIVQGNIMSLPFKRDTFDYVYSLGVLHHTPDTKEAFKSLVPYLKRGGRYSVWVYVKQEPIRERFNALWRSVTTRMPHSLLHYYCYLAAPKGLIDRKLSESKNRVLRYIGMWSNILVPVSTHSEWRVRVCDTFDWLSPEYQHHHTKEEVQSWFEENGFMEIKVLPFPVSVTGVKR